MLAAVAAVTALLLALHLPVVQRRLTPLLQRALSAAAGGTVTIGALEFNLWTGHVHGSDVRLIRPGLEFTAASLDVRARPWRGVVVSATEPRVVVSLVPDSAPAPPDQRPWTTLNRVAAIEVARGAIRVQRDDGSPVLEIAGLGARATRDESALRAAVVAESITVPRPGHESVAVMDARLDIELPNATQALHVRSAVATVGDARVRATGDLEQLNPVVGHARVEVPAGMSLVRTLARDTALEGEVAVRAEIVAERSGHRASFVADATAVRLAHVGPWDGRIAGHVEADVLHLNDVDLAAYGGRLQGLGTFPLDGATSHVRVQVRDIDLPHVLRSHASGTPRIASRVDADLSLQLTQWDPRTLAANGTVSLRPMTGPGIPVRGSATFSADQQRLRLSAATLRVRDAEARLSGTVGFDGRVNLRYGASLADASRLADMLGRVGVDMPPVDLTGTLAAEGTVDGPLDRWAATARLTGRRLAIEGLNLDFDSELRATPTSLRLVHFTAEGADGLVSASGEIPMGGADEWHIVGSLERLRFDDLLARHNVPLGGIANGRFEVAGPRTAPEMVMTLDADVSSPPAATADAPAVTVLVEASARASTRGVVVDSFRAHNGAGAVEGSGRWSAASGEVEARVRSSEFPLAAIPGLPPLPDLASVVTGDLEISGTLPVLTGRGSVTATRTVWRGAAFPDLRIDLASDGREVTLAGSLAQQPLLTGRMPLIEPWPVHVDIDLAALPIVDVMHAFPAFAKRDASATLSGRALVDVDLASPSQLRYEVRVEGAEGTFTQPWKTTPFSVRGTLDDVSVRDLEMQFDFGRLRVDGQVALTQKASGRLTVTGAAPLSYLALVAPVEEAGGEVLIDVTLAGSIASPSLAGTVRVANGSIRQGALLFDTVDLVATFDEGGAEIRQASAQFAGGQVYGTGALGLVQGPSDRYRLEVHGRGIDLGRLVPTRDDGPGITAVIDADLRAGADRLALDAVEADGSLNSLAISVAGRTLGIDGPVAVSLRSGTLTQAPLRLAGSAGHVTIESSAALVNGQPRLAVGIDGEIDLAAAGPLLGESGTVAGLARLNGGVDWDGGSWQARGEARVHGGRLALVDPPIVVSDLAATLRGEGDRIEVVEGSARVGDGAISIVAGSLTLASDGPGVDLVVRADRVPLEYPAGLRTRSSGDLRLTGRSGAFRLAGDILVQRAVAELEDARAAPGIDRMSTALDAFTGRGSLRDRTALDLRVRLDDGLRVATPLINLVVDGALRVGGTLLSPEVSGSLTFREGGTVRVSRALIRLEAGQVELSNYPARQPEVDVQGTTQVAGVGIDVSLSGPLDDVRMTLSSPNRSDLGQGDLATLILTGRTTSAAASESRAIVAEELASSLGRVINRQLGGFVMFDVSQDESLVTENTNSALQMNLAIPLGGRMYVIYSRGLDTGTQRWIVDVRPGRDFRLRVISNDDGSESVEASHRFGFDLWSRRSRPPAVRARLRIGSLTVVGVSPREETQVRSKLRLDPGDEFDFFGVQDAARKAQAWLVAEGFLEATVDARQETTAGGTVDVTVHVTRGPLVTIEWRGDDPGGSLRKRVASGWNSVLPREERAARLAREVRRTLQGSRFYAAVVNATVSDVKAGGDAGAEQVRVTFDVARGARGAGVDLRFEGNTSVTSATLAASLPPTNTAAFFALLEPDASRRLAAALRVAYATEGYLDMRAGTPSQSFGGRGERLNVTIPVVEGDRALLVALELPEEVRAAGDPSPVLALREGAPFRLDAYTADRARLLAWLRNAGHPDARVASVLEPRPGGLAVLFYADAGPQVTLGTVRTAREGRTRASVIDHAVATSPGDVIRASTIDEARRQLIDTRVFRSVDLRLEPVEGREDVRDIVVDVVERRDVNVEYSLRYTTAGQAQVGGAPSQTEPGLQVGAGVEFVNPFGWADRYRVSGLVGGERLLLNARYDRATFFNWSVPTAVVLYDDRTRLSDTRGLTQRVRAANFEQTRSWRNSLDGRRLHDRVRLRWGYSFRRIDFFDYGGFTPFDATGNGLRAGPIYSLIGDTRDSVTDPRRGTLSAISGEWALVGLGSDVNYIKTFGQVFVYVPVLPHLTWAQGYRIGFVPGQDPLLLLDGRFFAGGASSVRGFAEASLGPQSPEGEPLGGQASAIFNQELRFPIWKRLHGGVFYDAGNVFALTSQLDLLDLRQSAGVGLRLMFPFGPVRLEWAHVIDPRPGERPSRVVFSIGHAF